MRASFAACTWCHGVWSSTTSLEIRSNPVPCVTSFIQPGTPTLDSTRSTRCSRSQSRGHGHVPYQHKPRSQATVCGQAAREWRTVQYLKAQNQIVHQFAVHFTVHVAVRAVQFAGRHAVMHPPGCVSSNHPTTTRHWSTVSHLRQTRECCRTVWIGGYAGIGVCRCSGVLRAAEKSEDEGQGTREERRKAGRVWWARGKKGSRRSPPVVY